MLKTYAALLLQYETQDIPLELICEKYFGLSLKQAERKARHSELPVACFRGGSQKTKWLIDAEDLACYLDKIKSEARQAHSGNQAA